MAGLDFNNCVVALGTCNAPMLQELDLSYVAGLNDVALYKILSAPKDSRPGAHIWELVVYLVYNEAKFSSWLFEVFSFFILHNAIIYAKVES